MAKDTIAVVRSDHWRGYHRIDRAKFEADPGAYTLYRPDAAEEPPAEEPPAEEPPNATPSARALARMHGIDLTRVMGTGAGGRVTKADVQAYLEAT